MCIDLKTNKLHIGTTGTSTNFLSESELPDCCRLTPKNEEELRRESERVAKEAEDRALAEALAASARDGAAGTSASLQSMFISYSHLCYYSKKLPRMSVTSSSILSSYSPVKLTIIPFPCSTRVIVCTLFRKSILCGRVSWAFKTVEDILLVSI